MGRAKVVTGTQEATVMTKVLVVYGSRHGSTGGIAERIGDVLRGQGLRVEVASADRVGEVRDIDAFVVGSGVYMGSWLDEPLRFLERHADLFATRPLWLFSSGPLRGSTAARPEEDSVEAALGPADGPGSGGRKRITRLEELTHPIEHRVFFGAYDPADPPKALSERLARIVVGPKGVLPPGDFRDWDAIEAWAGTIAAQLRTPVAAGEST
jgi:menaquinone-dependent protoporphyrinogen oxidase